MCADVCPLGCIALVYSPPGGIACHHRSPGECGEYPKITKGVKKTLDIHLIT
nr:MAG TPA: 4Fe-4S single cluster domain protein [Caudoviricetes sp.]